MSTKKEVPIVRPEPIPKNLTHEPKSIATYNDYDVSDYVGTISSQPPSNFRAHDIDDRKEIKTFLRKSNPCSKKSKDESIPAIDISKISGEVTHQPVELIEEEGEYKGIHNFFEDEEQS